MEFEKTVRVNLGCGNKKEAGFIGVDRVATSAVDVITDISEYLPFRRNTVLEVLLDNVIEHVHDIPTLMKEIHRVCRNDATVKIVTPHFASQPSWRDPTHVHHLSYFSMDHFAKESVRHYMGGGFSVARRRLSFSGVMGLIGKLIFWISPREYEKNWCFIFRPRILTFTLKVEKQE
jgi:ubiquinone/menaquinone biosynthesis C-methylase UbiE